MRKETFFKLELNSKGAVSATILIEGKRKIGDKKKKFSPFQLFCNSEGERKKEERREDRDC